MTKPATNAVSPALSRFSQRKAEALLHNALPCLGCHTLDGDGGRIGPDLTTVASRRSADYIATTLEDPARVVPGTPMPRPRLDPNTRVLLVRYLATRGASGTPMPPSSPPPAAAAGARDGAALYAIYCASCHGSRGRGDGSNAQFLPIKPAVHASAESMSKRSDDALFDTIAGGGAIMNRSPRMPAFGGTLSSAEIRLLVKHIRTLCGCSGPAWSADGQRDERSPGKK